MLLCPADVEGSTKKEVFRPLEGTSHYLTRVDFLIKTWLSNEPLNKDADPVLEKKSVNGDANGVGAIWSVWLNALVGGKHKAITKVKKLYEVKAVIPNTKVVLEIRTDPTSVAKGGSLCQTMPILPPVTLTISIAAKGESSELSAHVKATVPSLFQTLPRILCMMPCFWPHLVIFFVITLVCTPCCYPCATTHAKQAIENDCDQGLNAIKSIAEKGPEQQMMSDGNYNNQGGGGGMVMVQPPMYAASAPYGGSPVVAQAPQYGGGSSENAFCTKCGNGFPYGDAFCGKCGNRR